MKQVFPFFACALFGVAFVIQATGSCKKTALQHNYENLQLNLLSSINKISWQLNKLNPQGYDERTNNLILRAKLQTLRLSIFTIGLYNTLPAEISSLSSDQRLILLNKLNRAAHFSKIVKQTIASISEARGN